MIEFHAVSRVAMQNWSNTQIELIASQDSFHAFLTYDAVMLQMD